MTAEGEPVVVLSPVIVLVERFKIGVPGGITVKFVALVAVGSPATSTVIGPVVAPDGTVAVICVPAGLTLDEAAMPLNLTAGVAPKLTPLMVTVSPTRPDDGVKDVMLGAVVAMGVIEAQVVPTRMLPMRRVGALPALP